MEYMESKDLRAKFENLQGNGNYPLNYTNSSIVPPTEFSVKVLLDKSQVKPPLFIISEPTVEHHHIVVNASENLVEILFAIEHCNIKALTNLSNHGLKRTFLASLLKDLLALAPSTNDIAVEALTLLTTADSIADGIKLITGHLKNNKLKALFESLLQNCLIAEHTRHVDGDEFVEIVSYHSGSRIQVSPRLSYDDFKRLLKP